MSLRQDLIEAGADELDQLAALSVGVGFKFAAESVLDAFLDTLEANADEWFENWTHWSDPAGDPKFVGLVAVLRGSA